MGDAIVMNHHHGRRSVHAQLSSEFRVVGLFDRLNRVAASLQRLNIWFHHQAWSASVIGEEIQFRVVLTLSVGRMRRKPEQENYGKLKSNPQRTIDREHPFPPWIG